MARMIFKATTSSGFITKERVIYADAHDAADGDELSGIGVTRSMNSWNWNGAKYSIMRAFLFFDTSELPDGANITAARIRFASMAGGVENDSGQGALHVVEGVQNDPLVLADYGDHLTKTTSGGSLPSASLISGVGGFFLSLNATGLGWINKTGTTKFCLRLAGDKDDSTPAGLNDFHVVYFSSTIPNGTTDAASGISGTQATLNGTFDGLLPTCIEVTYDGADNEYPKARFQYGLTASYGTNTAWQEALQHGDAILQAVSGLTIGETYHYRIQTENAEGNKQGSDVTFQTYNFPSDPMIRVAGLTHRFDTTGNDAVYELDIYYGGFVANQLTLAEEASAKEEVEAEMAKETATVPKDSPDTPSTTPTGEVERHRVEVPPSRAPTIRQPSLPNRPWIPKSRNPIIDINKRLGL